MSLALPSVAPSPASTPSWPLKGLALVLAVVLGLHWWLLGEAPMWFHWDATGVSQDGGTAAMQTRVLPPAAPPVPPPNTQPQAPKPVPPPARPAAPSTARPTATASALPLPFSPSAPVDIAPTAPESIAESTATPPPESPAEPVPAVQAPPQRYAIPAPVRLNYDVVALTSGNRNTAGAQISWKHDGANYQASLMVTKFLVNMRQWTSKGVLTNAGLAPVRFGDKGRGSEVAAHFVWNEGKVIFSANTPEAQLLPGAQDHLSVFIQLASMWAGEPQRFVEGNSLGFQSIGPRQSEIWTFLVSPEETITVPGGTFPAIKLTREPTGDYSTKAELWLAPKLAYLPAHIRLTETNGNVLDMVWTDSEQP